MFTECKKSAIIQKDRDKRVENGITKDIAKLRLGLIKKTKDNEQQEENYN